MVCTWWRETGTPRARSSAANSSPPVGWLQVRQRRARGGIVGGKVLGEKEANRALGLRGVRPRDILVRLEVLALGRGAPARAVLTPACEHARTHPMVGSLVWPREALQLRRKWFRWANAFRNALATKTLRNATL